MPYQLAWSSTHRRSRDSLAEIRSSGQLAIDEVYVDRRLDERSLGQLELTAWIPLPYADGDLAFAPDGGDNYLVLMRRILSFLLDIAPVTHPGR